MKGSGQVRPDFTLLGVLIVKKTSILADKMKYLTAKKLNTSDDERIKYFDQSKAEPVDAEKGIYGVNRAA